MTKEALVIYHNHCNDGAMAAAIFMKYLAPWYHKTEYVGAAYNSGKMPDVSGKEVFLLDFSYDRNTVENMLEYVSNITVVDHHGAALAALNDIKNPRFDMRYSSTSYCGAENTYLMACGNSVPRVVQLIGDRDLWKFEYAQTRAFTAGLDLKEKTPENMAIVLEWGDKEINDCILRGESIIEYKQQLFSAHIRQCTRNMIIGGFSVPVCNANGAFASDLGEAMYDGVFKNCPFVATYYDTKEQRCFSLRSRRGHGMLVDVIAQQYGGNGHPHAAGFKVDREHPLATS